MRDSAELKESLLSNDTFPESAVPLEYNDRMRLSNSRIRWLPAVLLCLYLPLLVAWIWVVAQIQQQDTCPSDLLPCERLLL